MGPCQISLEIYTQQFRDELQWTREKTIFVDFNDLISFLSCQEK